MAGSIEKFLLPSPNFKRNAKEAAKTRLHYLTPCGMTLLPREKQPPPMYGLRGSTLPAKFLQQEQQQLFKGEIGSTSKSLCELKKSLEIEYCETCNMKFQSINDLEKHKQQHEACPSTVCDYVGHPTVMDKHIEASHVSHLYEEVKKMSTPEDISAWIAERRKRYPTVANVEQRKRAIAQKQQRGERLEALKSCFGNVKDRKRVRQHNFISDSTQGKKKIFHPDTIQRSAEKELNKVNKNVSFRVNCEQVPCSASVLMFKGTSDMSDYKHYKTKTEQNTNALKTLLVMYGSDEDDETPVDGQEDKPDIKIHKIRSESTFIPKCNEKFTLERPQLNEQSSESDKYWQKTVRAINFEQKSELTIIKKRKNLENNSSDEAPEEVPIVRITEKPDKYNEKSFKVIKLTSSEKASIKSTFPLKKRIYGLNYHKRLRKQNTMLEKLLDGDIRHERNVLLQCVRFVCEQKYFGIRQN